MISKSPNGFINSEFVFFSSEVLSFNLFSFSEFESETKGYSIIHWKVLKVSTIIKLNKASIERRLCIFISYELYILNSFAFCSNISVVICFWGKKIFPIKKETWSLLLEIIFLLLFKKYVNWTSCILLSYKNKRIELFSFKFFNSSYSV